MQTAQHFGVLQGPKMHTVHHLEVLPGPKTNTVQHFGGFKASNCRPYNILGLQAKPATQTATLQKSRVAVEVFYLDFVGLQFGLQAWPGPSQVLYCMHLEGLRPQVLYCMRF